MSQEWKPIDIRRAIRSLIRRYIQFRYSLYSRVVLVIGLLSIFLLISYQIIFRTVNESYVKTALYQNGENVGSIVEGALYHSMLENNKMELQNTLDMINRLSGIDGVVLYDQNDRLAFTSFPDHREEHFKANCTECHQSLDLLFPGDGKSYRIIRVNNDCEMNLTDINYSQLMIRAPIMNQPSCYQNTSCHAHNSSDKILGSLLIKLPIDEMESAVKRASNLFTILAVFTTLLVASFLLMFTKRNIRRPLKRIIDTSQAIATGNSTARLKISNEEVDDIRTLSIAFNHMMDKLESANTELQNWSKQLEYKVLKKSEELGEIQSELISIERKASLGKLSSSVAHELNNPLSGILVYSKLVNKKLRNIDYDHDKLKPILDYVGLIEEETKRCGEIVKGLLDFSKSDQENFEPKNLHKLLDETLHLLNHSINLSNISLVKELNAEADLISCSPNQVKQVFVAIMVNASEAISEEGQLKIRSYNPDSKTIVVEISDNGIGMTPDVVKHIFEPFYTTKRDGKGTGLGLAVAHGIIRGHKGEIHVSSTPGEGTKVSVKIPLIKEELSNGEASINTNS